MEFLNQIQRVVLEKLKTVFPERDANFLAQKVAASHLSHFNAQEHYRAFGVGHLEPITLSLFLGRIR